VQVFGRSVLNNYNFATCSHLLAPAELRHPVLFLQDFSESQLISFDETPQANAGTPVAEAERDKQAEGSNRVRLLGWSCKALWGRRFTSERGGSFGGTELPNQSKSIRQGC
jgi:hypothetical protein